MPAGLLYAKVMEAQNVPNMDWLSKTDAYVRVFICGRRNRFTRVVWNSLNPRHASDPLTTARSPFKSQFSMKQHPGTGRGHELTECLLHGCTDGMKNLSYWSMIQSTRRLRACS